jgi:pimeloyl-ACP methyl ester carboxylesterase
MGFSRATQPVFSAKLNKHTRTVLGGTYCHLSDGVTHYRLSGPDDGQLVVLVHGGTVPHWIWDALAESLSAKGLRVLRYDQFGRGYSDRPKIAYDRALYHRQLRELVDYLDLQDSFHLVGLSMGGATAVNFTAHHPERVRRLVLIAPVISNYKIPPILKLPVAGELALRLVGRRLMRKRFVELTATLPDFERLQAKFLEQTAYKGFHRSFLSMMRSDALGNYDAAYRIVGRQDREILLIWGEKDAEISAEMIADVRRFMPDLDFRPVPEAGHGIVLEKPDLLNDCVLGFLSGENRFSPFGAGRPPKRKHALPATLNADPYA